jgi:shikimate 5-dehydrogenase
MNTGRILLGVLGKVENLSSIRSHFDLFINKQQLDVSFDYYQTKPSELHERLSEMWHHDRRGYLLAEQLQQAIIPLLDECKYERVNVIVNNKGRMIGAWLDIDFSNAVNTVEKLWEVWSL